MRSKIGCLFLLGSAVFLPGCGVVSGGAVGIANQVNGVRAESSGSAQSGTLAPNLFLGTGQSSICAAPVMERDCTTQVSVAYAESSSFFGSLFGLDARTRTFSYIGLPGETAEQTRVRLEAVAEILAPRVKTQAASTSD